MVGEWEGYVFEGVVWIHVVRKKGVGFLGFYVFGE